MSHCGRKLRQLKGPSISDNTWVSSVVRKRGLFQAAGLDSAVRRRSADVVSEGGAQAPSGE